MSLSDQLKKLQIPGQSSIEQAQSKKVSILFDSKTVASLNNETILNIASTGFADLCSIDPIFDQFEQLFNQNSLLLQRNLETKSFNKKVSKKIERFLVFLTPYILLKPSHRVLEWLVRRFQIHIHDQNSLMKCILPYHETQFFGRVAQLLPGNIEINGLWRWLGDCRKTGSGFNTATLVHHCLNNKRMMEFVFEMASTACELAKENPKSGLHILFSFHSQLIMGVIDALPTSNSEQFTANLLSLLCNGLKSSNKDLVCSSYMILGLLCSKCPFQKNILKSLLTTVVKSMHADWYEEALLCLIVMTTHQNVWKLSSRFCHHFLKLNWEELIVIFDHLNVKHDVSSFVKMLLPAFCEAAIVFKEEATKMHLVLDSDLMTNEYINLISRLLIDKLLSAECPDVGNVESVLKKISTRYSETFDEVLASFFTESLQDDKVVSVLQQITKVCMRPARYQFVEDMSCPVVIGLNHPQVNVRTLAVHQLFVNLKEDTFDEDETDFYRNAILARLADQSVDVVHAVLKHSKFVAKLLTQNDLLDVCLGLIKRTDSHYNINELILVVVKNNKELSERGKLFVYILLSHLLYAISGKRNKKIIGALKSIDCDINHPILRGICKGLKDAEPVQQMNSEAAASCYRSIISRIGEEVLTSSKGTDVLRDMWEFSATLDPCHDFQFVLLMISIHISRKSSRFAEAILKFNLERFDAQNADQNVLEHLDNLTTVNENLCNLFHSYLKEGGNSLCIGTAYHVLLHVLLEKVKLNKGSERAQYFNLVAHNAGRGTQNSKHFQLLLQQFLVDTFDTKAELLQFLCDIYTSVIGHTNANACVRNTICALRITERLISSKDATVLNETSVVNIHVALLSNENMAIRATALNNIALMRDIYAASDKKKKWNFILESVSGASNEIEMDSQFIKRLFQKMFNSKKSGRKELASLISKSKSSAKSSASLGLLVESLPRYPVNVQSAMLDMLEVVNLQEHYKVLLELLSSSMDQPHIVRCILYHINADLLNVDGQALLLFKNCLNSSDLRKVALGKLTVDFYANLTSKMQQSILNELLNIIMDSTSIEVTTEFRRVLHDVDISVEDVCFILEEFCCDFDANCNPTSEMNEEDFSERQSMRKTVEILEIFATKETVQKPEIASLFQVFKRCLPLTFASAEYIKQLILTSIHTALQSKTADRIAPEKLCLNLLIQCLQESKHLHTSQQCLKVIARAVVLFPSQILHDVMHIFTFMGGTMLRVDNQHTFEVIEKTINAIVPALVKSQDKHIDSRKRSSTNNDIILFILETFIDSAPHCPEHRRHHIFTHLVNVLNERDALHIALTLFIKKAIQQSQHLSVEEGMSPITMEFCREFVCCYDTSVQLVSLARVVSHLIDQGMIDQCKKSRSNQGDKQTKIFAFTAMSFIGDALEKISEATKDEESLTPSIIRLIEELLSYADSVNKTHNLCEGTAKKFYAGLLQKTYDCVATMYDMLPFNVFITVVCGLLNKKNDLIKKKSLELLGTKLSVASHIDKEQEEQLLGLSSTVLNLIRHKSDGDAENPVIKQLALYVFKLLAARLATNQAFFLESVPVITELYRANDVHKLVSVNAVLCVAELSSHLKLSMLPHLSNVIQPILSKMTGEEYQSKDLTLMSCISALTKILSNLAPFMSPYVSEILHRVSICESLSNEHNDGALITKVENLKVELGRRIPPRVLYPAIDQWLKDNLRDNISSVCSLVDVLRHSFDFISKADANKNFNETILHMFKQLFEVRSSNDLNTVRNVEEKCVKAFCGLVLKLSENTLRPMFLELFNWCSESLYEYRLCTFFHLSVELSRTLKGLFTMFVGHTLPKCADIVTALNTRNKDFASSELCTLHHNTELVTSVVDVLSNVFYYDSHGFVNRERFECVMQALVNQLENDMFQAAGYASFIQEHLLPCLVNLAAAVNDNSCWKLLNHQILLKTKSNHANVRLAALNVIGGIYGRLGESYMVLIPETIPFLAEILEDDSFEVESECEKVIKQIEAITGESLQKYF